LAHRGRENHGVTSSRPVRVDAVLAHVLEKAGVDKQVKRMSLVELWPEVVGEKLAAVTRVKGVDEDALFVEVRSSAWIMELSLMKDRILERVNARLEEAPIGRIVFVQAETT
jgi:predicted nucleic acid-binding Zn ribbon protein